MAKGKTKVRVSTPINSGTVAAYSIYATGASAAVYVSADCMLNGKKHISRKEKKKLMKIRDTAATTTAVGALVSVVASVKSSIDCADRCFVDPDTIN